MAYIPYKDLMESDVEVRPPIKVDFGRHMYTSAVPSTAVVPSADLLLELSSFPGVTIVWDIESLVFVVPNILVADRSAVVVYTEIGTSTLLLSPGIRWRKKGEQKASVEALRPLRRSIQNRGGRDSVFGCTEARYVGRLQIREPRGLRICTLCQLDFETPIGA